MSNVMTINPEQAQRVLAAAMAARVPTHFLGGPGVGKTSFHREFVEKLGAAYHLWPIHLSSAELGDFMLPVPDHKTGRVRYYLTDALPFDNAKAQGVVLFDDLTKARPELQPFVMNIMLDRFFHGHTLSDNVFVSATSNASSDLFNSEVCEALKTRACNLYVSVDAVGFDDSWQSWAEANGMSAETRAFRKYCADGLTRHSSFEEWAVFNDRTLAMADRVARALPALPFQTDDIKLPMLAGLLGRASAIKYVEMQRLVNEAPSPEEVVAGPSKCRIPDSESVTFALTCALIGYATKENARRIGQYATRMRPALALCLIKGIKDKAGCQCIMLEEEVQTWAMQNTALLT